MSLGPSESEFDLDSGGDVGRNDSDDLDRAADEFIERAAEMDPKFIEYVAQLPSLSVVSFSVVRSKWIRKYWGIVPARSLGRPREVMVNGETVEMGDISIDELRDRSFNDE